MDNKKLETKMKTYKDHPLSELFPLMGKAETSKLAEDIKANGLRAPITLLDGQILDGRNRARACMEAGVEPTFREHKNGDALAFVLSANLNRRHLTTSQRAMVAAKVATLKKGEHKGDHLSNASIEASQREAASQLNVSRASVQRAKKVIDLENDEDLEAIETGKKTVSGVLKEHRKGFQDKPKDEKKEGSTDKLGRVIPESMLEDWNRAEAIGKNLAGRISDVKCTIQRGIDANDVIFVAVNGNAIVHLENSFTKMKLIRPYVVCPTCEGTARKKCQLCKGRGYLNQFEYDLLVPAETKKELEKKSK